MNQTFTLIKPRLLSIKNKAAAKSGKGRFRIWLLLGVLALLFWGGIFLVSLKVLSYITGVEGLGHILAHKLLSMILLTIFSLLVFSNIIAALSKLYLSRDLALVHALPVPVHRIYMARWMESTMDSAWMVVVFTVPVLISYGVVFQAGPVYYLLAALVLLFLSVLASAVSAILAMAAVMAVPARRIRSIFILVGLILFILVFIGFRMLRPERLADPEVFATTLVYFKAVKTPSSPFLPTTWAFDCLRAALSGNAKDAGFHLFILLAATGALTAAGAVTADAVYFKGLSKAQTATIRFARYRFKARRRLTFFSGPVRAIVVKEIKTFFRDQTQWSQLFLIAGLVLVYIYNFSALPLERAPIKTIYLQNLLAFLNMGLAAFVLTAITARFAFPAVSIEKEAFWLMEMAPISKGTFLLIKFMVYFIPLLVVTEILIVVTNILLKVTPFMMTLSVVTIFFMVPGVVAIGIGLGAAYPDFKVENPLQAVTSFGGFLFMVICAGFIGAVIVLEAGPVYRMFMAGVHGRALTLLEWVWVAGSFSAALSLSLSAIYFPMRYGEKKLDEGGI
jgi:ABC-2 type transport system permease protein